MYNKNKKYSPIFLATSILVYCCSSLASQSLYNFDFIASKTAYSLFDNVEQTAKQKTSKNQKYQGNDDSITIKWEDNTHNKESNNITVLFKDSTINEKYANSDSGENTKYAFADWFQEPYEPEVLKKRKLKTNFTKNDPYYGKHLCNNGEYTCIKLNKNDSWNSLFPNKYHRELVQRVNRTNKGLWNRSWILVPNDVNRDYMDFSPLPYYHNTNGKKTIIVDISDLAFGAYDKDGDLVHWGPVNPGKASSQTVKGDNFKVYRKGDSECWSKKYESKIPYCMFFHEGFALHGFSMPGYPASHGCVRTYVDDALWLNKNFADYKTRVIVRD